MPSVSPTLTKFVIGFAVLGGVGIPLSFIALWALARTTLAGNPDALYHASAWIEAFRVMLWPSSLLIVVRALGDSVGEMSDLVIAVITNVGVYALVGLATALACRSRTAVIALVVVLLMLTYTVNAFWSSHLASFLIAAVMIAIVFVALFRKYGVAPAARPTQLKAR